MVPIWLIYPESAVRQPASIRESIRADLEEQSIAGLLLNGSLDSHRVGDGQIITDNLDLGLLGQSGPSLPVVLVKGVLDRADIVLLSERVEHVGELNSSDGFALVRVGVLRRPLQHRSSHLSRER